MSARGRAKKMARVAFYQFEKAVAGLDRGLRRARRGLLGEKAIEREAAHWARSSKRAVLTWQDHPVIMRHVNRRVSGDPGQNWLAYLAGRYARGFDFALNLGCGFGGLEAHALSLGLARGFHSVDISKGALAVARRRLAGLPVAFEIADVNAIRLAPGTYDVVFSSSSLHHFVELEHVLSQVRLGLKREGLFVFNEYVGPSRFQWGDEQLRIVNQVLAALAPRYRKNLWKGFGSKRRVFRPPLDVTSRDSPFEAARSEEIIPLVRERFDIVLRRDYGGAVLHPLLDGIAGNFLPEREEDVSLLERLAALEEELEQADLIASDFTMIVAGKKRGGGHG